MKKRQPIKKGTKREVLLSELLRSEPSGERARMLKPVVPRARQKVPSKLPVPTEGRPPEGVVLSDKGRPVVRVSDLHHEWANLGTVSHQKRQIQRRIGDKVQTTTQDYLQMRLPGVKLGQIGRHLFADVLESGAVTTGLLYNAGYHTQEKPLLSFASRREKSLMDLKTLEKLALDLQSCDDPEKRVLPDFRDLVREAKAYYRQKNVVPILVLDVEFELLDESVKRDLGIDSRGVLQIDDVASQLKRKNVYAYAPAIEHFGNKKVQFVVDKRFILTNREIPDQYAVALDGEPYAKADIGTPFSVEFKDADQAIFMSIALGQDRELANISYTSAMARAIPPFDLSWEPVALLPDSGSDSGKLTAIRAYVFHSIHHDPSGPEIQNPLIILGGFDEDFTTYPLMYDRIAAIQYPDFVQRLREAFDVVLLTYSDVSVSIELNARALAFTLRDIIERNEGHDGLVFIGISMGGLVSRMALAGIENRIFNNIGADLGGPIAEHNVKVWVTIDTPHQGAHIPLGMQYLVHWLGSLPIAIDEVQPLEQLLSSTSAKEMLIEHYEAGGGTTTERAQFHQKLSAWGGFPTEIITTIAVTSGALDYVRGDQAWWIEGNDCETAGFFEGCVHTYDAWGPRLDFVDSVRNDANMMYNPQDNRGGQRGLRILDIILDFGADLGIPVYITAWINTRAIEYYYYQYGEYNPGTPVFGAYVECDLPWPLSLFVDDKLFSEAAAIPPGIPYAVYVGGWLPTAESVYNRLSEEFPSAAERLDDDGNVIWPHLWLPRHCFVPLISALDMSEEYLKASYYALINNWETQNGCNLFPTYARWRGEFSYADFVDYDKLEWLGWNRDCYTRPVPSPGKPGACSGQIGNSTFFVWERDPETGVLGKVLEEGADPMAPIWKTHSVRKTNFDWVYFHEENKQHGELDFGAIEFIMDKITRTLSGELPHPPTPGYSPLPQNKVMMTTLFLCTNCGAEMPFPPLCDNCGVQMTYDEAKGSFTCSCGNEVPWPMHCGEPMTIR